MLHFISTAVIVLLAFGISQRKLRPDLHKKSMLSAFAIDISLVLYIELTRHAVETVVTHVKPLVWFHAGISTSVIVLYIAMFVYGHRLEVARRNHFATNSMGFSMDDSARTRSIHRNLGMTFCLCRLVNYVTAFMI